MSTQAPGSVNYALFRHMSEEHGLTPAEVILFALADEWDDRARRAKLDEEWHIHRDSLNARTANTRWSVYRSCAEELRRRLVDASVRQPTPNVGSQTQPPKTNQL